MMEVTKILERKDGIKYCIVPKKSKIKKADCVAVIKIEEEKIREEIKSNG